MPSVRQLEAVLEEHERIGVLLVDRKRARMFVFELGELVEHSERSTSWSATARTTAASWSRRGSAASSPSRRCSTCGARPQLAFEVFQRGGFDRLVLGAPPEVRADLEHALHPYLRERIAGQVALKVHGLGRTRSARPPSRLEQRHRAPRRGRAGRPAARRRGIGRPGRRRPGADARRAVRAPGRPAVRVRGLRGRGLAVLGLRVPGHARAAAARLRAPSMQQVPDVVEVAVAQRAGQPRPGRGLPRQRRPRRPRAHRRPPALLSGHRCDRRGHRRRRHEGARRRASTTRAPGRARGAGRHATRRRRAGADARARWPSRSARSRGSASARPAS